jgi:anti-sigma-K factor RskA
MKAVDLDRLLRSAAQAEDAPAEMPFGFDTRVVARARRNENTDLAGLARFVRRVALAATAIIILATAGAYVETDQIPEPFANEFAITDSALQEELLQ